MKPSSTTPKNNGSANYSSFPQMTGTPQNMNGVDKKKFNFPANPTKPKQNQRIKPLSREFFVELIKLETDFHNKNYTVETLDELTQYYARAVEYYDSLKDNIASYFLYKIQDTLATKKSLKLLIEQNRTTLRRTSMADAATSNNGEKGQDNQQVESRMFDSGIKKKAIDEQSDDDDDDDEEEGVDPLELKRRKYLKKRGPNRQSISHMKSEKAKFVNYFVKVENNKHLEKQNMFHVLQEFASTMKENDQIVKYDIDGQKERLRARLEQKKITSFMNHTHQTGMQRLNSSTDGTYENFLDGLGDKEYDSEKKFEKYNDLQFSVGSKIPIKEEDEKEENDYALSPMQQNIQKEIRIDDVEDFEQELENSEQNTQMKVSDFSPVDIQSTASNDHISENPGKSSSIEEDQQNTHTEN